MGVFVLYFLSIDFGTSAVKLSAVDENGIVKAWAKEPYPYILLPGEKSEISPSELTGALFRAAGKLWQQDSSLSGKIGMICYDTFSPSPVFMDKDGNLTYPNIITHMDRRSRAESEDVEKITIAYAPVWAIVTGKTASSQQADEGCGVIRSTIASLYSEEVADKVLIQYGGSMNAANAKELLAMPNIDGGLIGGASLKAEDFQGIVRFGGKNQSVSERT